MNLLFGHDRDVAHFVACNIPHLAPHVHKFGYGEVFGAGAAIGVIDSQGRLVGGVVYHNYNPIVGNIELSFASTTPRWLTKRIVSALLRYSFVQLGCQRVTGCTPRRATSARRFLEKFGFKREGSVRRGFGNDNAIISGLLREEWDVHPLNVDRVRERAVDGQVRQDAAAA